LIRNASTFKPCGLQSIAMFTDEYALTRIEQGGEVTMDLDTSDIYLKEDDDIYKGKIDEASDNAGPYLTINGERSWIEAGAFYNHFKVWMRSPASPHVRHLWAVKKNGLQKGNYRLDLLQNSAIWTTSKSQSGWELDEKRVVFSTQNMFGSKGAAEIMAAVCLFFAFLQVVVMISFITLGFTSKDLSALE